MSLLDLILTAIGLAADAFAVSITNSLNKSNKKKVLIFSTIMFGLFQAIMPIIGYTVGTTFTQHVSKYSNIIGFILLAGIGINSIYESYKNKDKDNSFKSKITISIILLQAIATSIDALAVGVTFAVLNVNIFSASLYIGLITTLICLIGLQLGKIFGNVLGSKSEILGGIILLLIGIKILLS